MNKDPTLNTLQTPKSTSSLLPYIIAVLLIAGLVLGVTYIVGQDRYRLQLAGSLSRRINHKVVLGKLRAGLFPPSLHLDDVNVLNVAQDTTLLHAETIDAPLSILALFHLSFVPRSLVFHQWQAVLHRKEDGGWAWEEWFVPAAQLGEKAGWPLKQAVLDRGDCHAMDPFGPEPQEFVIQVIRGTWDSAGQMATANGTLASLPAPVNFVFQGQVSFFGAPRWSGNLDLTDETRQWTLAFNAKGGAIQANGQAKAWRFDDTYALFKFYSRLPLTAATPIPSLLLNDWVSHFDWQGGKRSFSHTAVLSGGQVELKGQIATRAHGTAAQLDIGFSGVNMQPVAMVIWGTAPIEGAARGLGHLEVELSSSPWSSLRGQGAFEILKGRYYWPRASVQAFSKAHIMRYLAKKFPGFPEQGLPIVTSIARWRAQRGIFSFDDVSVNLGDLQIALAGKFDAARRGLDAFTRVQVYERRAGLLKELPANYVTRAGGRAQVHPIFGHLQGAPNEWRLRSVRAGKIPPAILAKLRRALAIK